MLLQLKNNWQVCFFVTAALFVFSTFYEPYPLSWLLKILPMLVLISIATDSLKETADKWLVLGLVFSMMGDFILDYFGQSGFIFGLASFFIAHVFYLLFFGHWHCQITKLVKAAIILAYGIWAMSIIINHLGSLFYPVIAYMLILLLMAFAALFSNKANGWFIAGGISFVISDSVLGINKFAFQVTYSHLIIMVSYYFAQYGLVKGYIHSTKKNQT